MLRLDHEHWVALNNRAVVTMYNCKLAPALQDVETAFVEAPWAMLQVRVCVWYTMLCILSIIIIIITTSTMVFMPLCRSHCCST